MLREEISFATLATLLNLLVRIGSILALLEALVLVYFFVRSAVEGKTSPEAGPGMGLFLVGILFGVLAGATGLLYFFAGRQSRAGVIVIVLLMAYPMVMVVLQPAVMGWKKLSYERQESTRGDFSDPVLKQMAARVRANDAEGLRKLLNGQPPPDGLDRAGEDLLSFALHQLWDRKGGLDCPRAILETGIDLRKPRTLGGGPLLHFMLRDSKPESREAVKLLIAHGADPNLPDSSHEPPIVAAGRYPELVKALVEAGANIDAVSPDGVSAVVSMMMRRDYTSALYLVELGAKLDTVSQDGLSVDYVLKDWSGRPPGEEIPERIPLKEAILRKRK